MILWHNETGILSRCRGFEVKGESLNDGILMVIWCLGVMVERWAGQCWIRHPDNFFTLLKPALVKLLEAVCTTTDNWRVLFFTKVKISYYLRMFSIQIRLQCSWSSTTIFFCLLGTVMQELQWQKAERCREPLREDSEGLKMTCRVLKQSEIWRMTWLVWLWVLDFVYVVLALTLIFKETHFNMLCILWLFVIFYNRFLMTFSLEIFISSELWMGKE